MIELPADRLPDDPVERRRCLDRYFAVSGRIANADQTDTGWLVELTRPPSFDYFIDPSLEDALAMMWGITRADEVADARQIEGGVQLSLQDAWTASAWSRWLYREPDVDEVIILHVDYHDDFMSPLLGVTNGGLLDLVRGAPVTLTQPASVDPAIESGAIDVGTFFAPFLGIWSRATVRHLSTHYGPLRPGRWELKAETMPDTLLSPELTRPAVAIVLDAGHGGSTYQVTADPTSWLSDLPDAPCLLHIDLDFFNNRFNGDSDWNLGKDRHDPALSEIIGEVDRVFDALEKRVGSSIVSAAIALSPGFFPAEYWQSAIERVLPRLASLA